MRRADFLRCKQTRRNVVAHSSKLFGDLSESEFEVSSDILQEHLSGFALSDDSSEVGPEMAGISGSGSFPGDAERLARVAPRDKIHLSTPRSRIKRGDVIPNRSLIQPPFFHARCQNRSGIGFPLHETDSSERGYDETEPEFESTDPGT